MDDDIWGLETVTDEELAQRGFVGCTLRLEATDGFEAHLDLTLIDTVRLERAISTAPTMTRPVGDSPPAPCARMPGPGEFSTDGRCFYDDYDDGATALWLHIRSMGLLTDRVDPSLVASVLSRVAVNVR